MDEGDPRLFWIPYMDETLEEFCRRLLRSKMNMKRKGIHQFLTFFTLVFAAAYRGGEMVVVLMLVLYIYPYL